MGNATNANPYWIAMLTLVVIAANAAAQTPPAPNSERKYFSLTRLDTSVELRAEYDDTRVRTTERSGIDRHTTQDNRATGFEEFVTFDLAGHLTDPQVVSFSGNLSLGLAQDRFHEGGDVLSQTDEDHGRLLRYDLRADLFTGKPLSGSLYGLRAEDRINRRFQPTLREHRNGFGTNWSFADDVLPMDLSYDYLETDRTGNRDSRDDEHYTQDTFHYGADWNIAPDHRARFTYEHAENKQEYQGIDEAFETTRDLFRLDHTYEFGGARRHELKSLLHWQEESGDFARDLFEVGPQLTLNHSDDLQTRYQYQFNRQRYETLDVRTHRVDWSLTHRLFSNLTTTLDLFALRENIENDVRTTLYGGNVDWQYKRNNRFGTFNANLALGYNTEEINGSAGRRLILDESGTFRDPFAVTLRNRDVIPASIVVTDVNNRRVFRPGLDYAVRIIGNSVQLERIATGLISDGDTVFVDYQIERPTDGQVDTIRTDFTIEQRFSNGLTPYYRLAYRNQETNASTGFERPADRTDHHRVGLKYDADRYSLGAEYEIFDDTVDPYHGFHLNGRYGILRQPEHTLDLAGRFSRLFFEDRDAGRNVSLLDIELDHRWRLSERVSTIERIAYRYEDDSSRGLTHAVDVSAGFEYAWGDLSGELTFDYDHLGLPGSNEDDVGVFFRLRRNFRNASIGR